VIEEVKRVMVLLSLQVGRPRAFDGDEPWVTSIHKQPVAGPRHLGPLNLADDEQADLTVHGGPDKAVCAYSADHFGFWRDTLGRPDLGPGAFGENFTLTGVVEASICLGDICEVGAAVVQVSQPRSPCWKLGRRWARLDLPKLVLREGRTGWYFRVLQPGIVEAGQEMEVRDRPYPQWTIAEVNRVAYAKRTPAILEERHALATCPALAESWRLDLE